MLKNEIICKINDPSTDLLKDTYVTMLAMTEEGEKQFKSFIHKRLLYQKVSLGSITSKANAIGKISPSIFFSHKENIYSAIEHRQDLSRTVFGFEFQNVAHSLSSDPVSLYHGTKSDIMIRFANASVNHHLQTKCIVLKMSLIIKAKMFFFT